MELGCYIQAVKIETIITHSHMNPPPTQTPPKKHPSQHTLSLPKIRTLPHELPPSAQAPKLSKQIHKIKWSIAPKCLLPGHEGQQILYLCIHPECKEPTRLVCETCFFREHEKHNQNFLAIDQVRKGDIQKLRFWPFQRKYRKIFQFVTKHQSYVSNMVQDINATFNGMAMRIIGKIDKIRLNLLKAIDTYYLKQTQKQKFSQKLKTDLQECFQLKKLSEIVRQMFSKEIRHQVFQQKMQKLLNQEQKARNREILLKYFESGQKGTDMFFDKMHFMKKENWILEQIQEQKKALKEQAVTIDQAEMGIEKIVVQTIDYLNKNAEGMYPLQFDKRQLQDGSTYNGFLFNGLKTLFGMRTYKNGFVYYGEWKNNARNGWGVYENKTSGYRYAGQWKQDRKSGYGCENTLTWTYQGNYVADKKEGFGVMIQDGRRIEIGWKNDKKNGKGKIIEKDGTETQIYFLNGVESQMKTGKASPAFDLKQLTKRFGSVKSTSD